MAISFEECFEMNFDGRCEEFDSCEECEEECISVQALKQMGE